MESFYPLTFNDNLHTALWGTESWEISGHASSPSTVANGPFAGRTLESLAAEFGRAFMGTRAPSDQTFPLLFKVIDAKKRLSVQVHPNEETKALTGGEPKTEMWRVLGGHGPIFAGLKPGTTPEIVAANVQNGRFEETLVRHDAQIGLTLFIPGGLVHAIGEDVLIYEVQQSSNTTYRLYDWGRVGADGKPRQLHIAESLKSIDFNLPVPASRETVSCPFFNFRPVQADGEIHVDANPETFTALFLTEIRQSILVPANTAASIPATGTVLVTTM